MPTKTSILKKATKNYGLQLAAVLAIYAIYHAIAEHIFFEGFLFTIPKLNHIFFGDSIPGIFANIPFQSHFIFLSALTNPYFLLSILAFYIPLIIQVKPIRDKHISFDKPTRIIIFIAAAALAWELSSYDYNYYLDHAFYFDRLLLVILALLILRYPLLTPIFLALAFVYRAQFNYPVAGFPLFDKRVLYDVLILFMAHTYVRLFIPSFRVPFLYFILCMVGANYFMTGIKKLFMQPHIYGWITYNKPGDLFTNVHYRGWLTCVSDDTIHRIAAWLNRFGILLQGIVLLIELSGILLLRSKKLAIPLLCSFATMHIGIFLLGSMLFWKWMVIDIGLVFIILRSQNDVTNLVFTKRGFLASLIIIILSPVWLKPIMIGWYDSPANQFFTYEVCTTDGKTYEVDKNEMNPYHQWFEYDNFLFLVPHASLRISGFGYTNKYQTVQAIRRAGPENFKQLEANQGRNMYDPAQKEKFDAFIKKYFRNRNHRLSEKFIPSYFKAPNHLYSYAKTNDYKNAGPVQRFKVIFNQVYTKDGQKIVIDRDTVDDILIPND